MSRVLVSYVKNFRVELFKHKKTKTPLTVFGVGAIFAFKLDEPGPGWQERAHPQLNRAGEAWASSSRCVGKLSIREPQPMVKFAELRRRFLWQR